ncbi:AtpZ/AtpI family protein [uncultured Eudoraea sp.]|uniref:AtpZ/AtpI family protein n=1 Tax=uncultured Eudoraea sp. TaxID=1035614 RepID=UPI002628DC92|nr:AtpZ/AtpI family protein [uncultured Eudoraea sp.]
MSKGKKQAKYWLSLTGIAVQMGVIIYLGARLGQWLDMKYLNDKNTYTIILTLFAVAISMYLVIQQTKKLNS